MERRGLPGLQIVLNQFFDIRRERPPVESAFVRVVATCGVIGIGVALGAILASQHVAGWITGLVVASVSVVISAVLWSSRRM